MTDYGQLHQESVRQFNISTYQETNMPTDYSTLTDQELTVELGNAVDTIQKNELESLRKEIAMEIKPKVNASTANTEWADPPPKCEVCHKPLAFHWRERPCLAVSDTVHTKEKQ